MSPKIDGFDPIPVDDVASGLRNSAGAFAQLAALLAVIRDKSPELSDARNLAALGWSVALDMENFAADTLERLQKGGIRQ